MNAALSLLRERGMPRSSMIAEHAARSYKSFDEDAFHPWTLAQHETDYWRAHTAAYLRFYANALAKC